MSKDEDPNLLNDGEFLRALKEAPEVVQTLILHVIARHDRIEKRLGKLEEIVYVVLKTVKWLRTLYPVILPAGGFILARLVM